MRPAHLLGACLALACFAMHTDVARAQDSGIAVEFGGGLSIPSGDFASDPASPGQATASAPGLAVRFVSRRSERLRLHLGFAQHRFDCAELTGCAGNLRYVATGLSLGARFSFLPDGAVDPWVGLGLITQTLEGEGLAPGGGRSDTGIGGEASVGLTVPVGTGVSLRPMLGYSVSSPSVPDGPELPVRHLAAHLLLVLGF